MARLDKDEKARREGMAYAYGIAQKEGIEALKKEIERRGITNTPIAISSEDLARFSEIVKNNVVQNMQILIAITLRDEFEFGHDRITRMLKRFESKADCLVGDYTTWDDQIQILAEEVGIKLDTNNNSCHMQIGRQRTYEE